MKISIITVSYNSAKTIRNTIESILSQNNKNIEYILVDGNSIDSTVDIVKSYEKDFKLNDIDYKWISEDDNGLYDAINKGIMISTGDIIGILNSDDFFIDNDVVTNISNSFNNSGVDCVYGNLLYVKSKDVNSVTRIWKSKSFKKGLFAKSWTPAHPTFYCKKELYEKYGLYRTDFKIASDVELMYRFLEVNNANSLYLDINFIKMREGGISNRGIKSTITITKELMQSFKESGAKFNVIKYLFFKFLKIKQILLK